MERKFALEQYLWNTYYALYQLRLQENLQKGMLQAKENKESLDETFYKRIQAQTEKDMETETMETANDSEISAVRQKIQNLLN